MAMLKLELVYFEFILSLELIAFVNSGVYPVVKEKSKAFHFLLIFSFKSEIGEAVEGFIPLDER